MKNERIFIVEDERIIAIDLKRRLERLGYTVCGTAANSEDAILAIEKEKPDLVLMDIVIQGEKDGIEVAVHIRKKNSIPVIFLSAYTDGAIVERAKEAEPLGYILKPFKERELAATIEMALFKNVADAVIRKKEEMFAAILNSTTDAILVVGKNGKAIFLNPEAEQLLEIREKEAKLLPLDVLFTLSHPDTQEPYTIPELTNDIKVIKEKCLTLTNRNHFSFVVEMTINLEISIHDTEHNYILSFKDISQLHEISDSLKYQATHDSLTGLLNRNEFAQRLSHTLANLKGKTDQISAIFIDIDRFKVINDSCGTEAGDVLLKETARKIRAAVTTSDYAARLGGDDFIIVYNGDSALLCEKLLEDCIKETFVWNTKKFPFSLSIAVVPITQSFKSEHEIMITGTQLVKSVNQSGGAKWRLLERTSFAPLANTASISDWISTIHEAIHNDEFRLYFQHIQPLDPANDTTKNEILLRMVAKDGTIILPDNFIPIAERYNIMPLIDRWVINKAFQSYRRLMNEGHPLSSTIFCINLSGSSLADESIIKYIIESAETHKVPPHRFCIELTESSAILNLTSASRFVYILKEKGFSIALDDFGSGFSSFGYLKNLAVDFVKIDGSFIRNMNRDQVDYTMVQAISSMCKVLGLKTIGEYAENTEIISMLSTIGVDYAQGFGIAHPQPLP